jgi:RNA polymerase sigma factor (sigma-70 family)
MRSNRPIPPPPSHTGYTDPELIRLCLSGDRLAWATLIDRYFELINSIPRIYGLNDKCRDVRQIVCVKLMESLNTLQQESKLAPWLMKTTSNVCKDILRLDRRYRPLDHVPGDPPHPALTAEEGLIIAQDQETLREVMDLCPERCRILIYALYHQNMPHKEAATLLSCSPDSIGSLRKRCIERIREMLRDRGITRMSLIFEAPWS